MSRRSGRPSPSWSSQPAPGPKVSGLNILPLAPDSCWNTRPAALVISVNRISPEPASRGPFIHRFRKFTATTAARIATAVVRITGLAFIRRKDITNLPSPALIHPGRPPRAQSEPRLTSFLSAREMAPSPCGEKITPWRTPGDKSALIHGRGSLPGALLTDPGRQLARLARPDAARQIVEACAAIAEGEAA